MQPLRQNPTLVMGRAYTRTIVYEHDTFKSISLHCPCEKDSYTTTSKSLEDWPACEECGHRMCLHNDYASSQLPEVCR